ncbi:MAG: RDD family protein [Candidatus Limnocylindrales bacterium]
MPGVRWAGVGARFGALVLDFIVLVGALFVLSIGLSAMSSSAQRDPQAATAIGIVWWLLVLMYHPACWYVFGASAGQKALGMRVARASDGQALGIGGVLARYLVFSVVTALVPLGIVSAIMTSKDPYKRAWHDQVARSVVVARG